MAYLEKNYDSILIRVSAHDAIDQGQSLNNTGHLRVDLTGSAQRIFDGVRAIQFCNASIPNTFYNVPEGRNSLQYTDGVSGLNMWTLSAGQYDITQVMSALQTQLASTTGSTVVVDLNPQTYRIRITISAPIVEVTFSAATYDTNPLGYILGMNDVKSADLASSGGVLEFPCLPRLNGVSDVIINCPQIAIRPTPDLGGKASSENYLARIPMNVPFGSVAHYDVSESVSHIFDYNRTHQFMGGLDIFLTDDRDNPLDPNGADWSFTIKVFTV